MKIIQQLFALAIAIVLFGFYPNGQLVLAESLNSNYCSVVDGSIYDGDTLRVNCAGEELRIRFCGIDAPELKQPMGIESRDHLRSLIAQGDGSITIIPIEQDRFGRTVAELMLPVGDREINLNSQMTLDGYAWHYTKYSGNCPSKQAIADGEAIAKEQEIGLWPTPPWKWRKSQ